jgi:3-oxoacyl-[acyl-carrier protein] reductase
VLVNCAGFTQPVPAADLDGLTDELIDAIFASNWRGTFATIRAFAPQMKAHGDAVIVNVSSIAAFTGLGSNLAYAAAKAGTDALSKALAKTLAPQIRVLAVSPGMVDTGFVPGRDAGFNEKAAATIPLRRVGTADDVAAAIVACCTSLRYATGSIVVADGGRHLG